MLRAWWMCYMSQYYPVTYESSKDRLLHKVTYFVNLWIFTVLHYFSNERSLWLFSQGKKTFGKHKRVSPNPYILISVSGEWQVASTVSVMPNRWPMCVSVDRQFIGCGESDAAPGEWRTRLSLPCASTTTTPMETPVAHFDQYSRRPISIQVHRETFVQAWYCRSCAPSQPPSALSIL